MAGSLWGDPKAVFTRELDDLDDVLDGLDQRDRDRPLINREVPRPTSVVPLGVAWKHEAAGEPAPQGVEIARPGAIGEIRGTSAIAHVRHATSSTFSVLTARRCATLPAVRAAGLEHRTPYSMRHTFASFAIAAGLPTFEIARMMGTSIAQIEGTYGHLLPDPIERARVALDAFASEVRPAREAAQDDL
jgi:integrase